MGIESIGLSSVGNTIGQDGLVVKKKNEQSEFENMFQSTIEGMENNQKDVQQKVKELLTTGEGDSAQTLIEVNKATSQIKMAAKIRDEFSENLKTLMSIQI